MASEKEIDDCVEEKPFGPLHKKVLPDGGEEVETENGLPSQTLPLLGVVWTLGAVQSPESRVCEILNWLPKTPLEGATNT